MVGRQKDPHGSVLLGSNQLTPQALPLLIRAELHNRLMAKVCYRSDGVFGEQHRAPPGGCQVTGCS
jgi:hypothetical protein